MHEVITISLGHRCNHLSTQFFNCQEKKLTDEQGKENDFSVYLNPNIDRLHQTISFEPRALIWEAKGGNGSLGKYQYGKKEDYYYSDATKENDNVILTSPRVRKSEYQIALDDTNGKSPPQLNNEMAKYWSDYSRLIYNPSTFNNLKDWNYDPSHSNLPDFKGLNLNKFDRYALGTQEFNDNYLQEFFDGNLHKQLEQCDTLQGFNLISSLDSAWGGFASSLLVELRNELPKSTVFAWNYYNKESEKRLLPVWESQVKSSVVCNEEADLVFPLQLNNSLSDWKQAGQTVRVLDSVNSLLEQKGGKRESMTHLRDCVALSDQIRKFVSSISEDTDTQYNYSFFDDYPASKNKRREPHVFSECFIQRGQSIPNIKSNSRLLQTDKFLPSDTVPLEFQRPDSFTLHLSATEKSRDVFLQWRDMAYKYLKSDPDKDELIDSLGTMAATYEYGWYDDDDSGDDVV